MSLRELRNYTTYEYITEYDRYGEVIFLANIRKDDEGKDLLEVSLKIGENAGTIHFAFGKYAEDTSEVAIKTEIERLIKEEFFDPIIEMVLEEEQQLEEFQNDIATSEENQ